MSLASRFAAAHVVRANQPLADHESRVVAPSIFADNAHTSRSDRYAYIPTIKVLDALRQEFEFWCKIMNAMALVNNP